LRQRTGEAEKNGISDAGTLGREALRARADRWIFLNYFRNIAGVVSYVFLLFALLTPSSA
jgi:hypothetical protein